MNAGAGGITLGDADHRGGISDQELQAGDASAFQESLGTPRADELQAVQRARGIKDRHDQGAVDPAQVVGGDTFACQVRMPIEVVRTHPF